MSCEPSKTTAVIERNKDSPFQILDVRSISEETSTLHYPPLEADTGALSDASSGSEKALVIDMADEESTVRKEAEPEPKTVKICESTEKSIEKKDPPMVTNVRKERVNRRKSHHVPLAMDDLDFGMSMTVGRVEAIEDQKGLNICKNIVKHNELLRCTINHILEQRYDRNFNFDAADTDTRSFEQLRRWINCYEKIKKESATEKALQKSRNVSKT